MVGSDFFVGGMMNSKEIAGRSKLKAESARRRKFNQKSEGSLNTLTKGEVLLPKIGEVGERQYALLETGISDDKQVAARFRLGRFKRDRFTRAGRISERVMRRLEWEEGDVEVL